jgi:hypothetical protein
MADHNDPNAVNSIFSDINPTPADLYDMFGFPGPDHDDETLVLAVTFASIPTAGTLDPDLLYRVRVHARHRASGWSHGFDLAGIVHYVEGITDRYTSPFETRDIRAWVDEGQKAHITLTGFPGGDLVAAFDTNTVSTIATAAGSHIKAWMGGRDDAFFNDLPGFFRSINYAPQYYHVPHDATMDLREVPIPKTLLELDGNKWFNFDPADPNWGHGVKRDLPSEAMTWTGDRFAKDPDGNYRLVYSGKDAQAGHNVNCLVLELPLAYVTADPANDRVVDIWAESWVRKASGKVPDIPDHPIWIEHPFAFLGGSERDPQLRDYKRVDTTAQPFADAALNQRENSRQIGGPNFVLAPHFVKRLGHLGWGFGPSVTALGLPCSFDHGGAAVSVHREYSTAITAFHRTRKVIFQELRMPDDDWNPRGLDIPLRRPVEIFIPNVCAVDMDTTGTWPYGRRLEDQVATRFLSLFIDQEGRVAGKPCHIEILNDQALWDAAPVTPKTPPNPLHNDTEFLAEFPYLAPPWPPSPH